MNALDAANPAEEREFRLRGHGSVEESMFKAAREQRRGRVRGACRAESSAEWAACFRVYGSRAQDEEWRSAGVADELAKNEEGAVDVLEVTQSSEELEKRHGFL